MHNQPVSPYEPEEAIFNMFKKIVSMHIKFLS